jgi:TRAP transporter TAXI family solute receptor
MNEKMGIKTRVQPYSGSSTYIPLLNRNELNFALVNVSDGVNAREGITNFKGQPQTNLRLINVMFMLRFSILVPGDSPVQKIEDIKGLRLPSGFTSQTTIRNLMRAVLASGGLKEGDLKTYPTPNVFKGVALLGEGRVDAAGIAVGVAPIQKAAIKLRKRGGVRFISIGKDEAAMNAIVPSSGVVVKPAPHLKGIVKPTTMMGFRVFLTTNDQASDKMVYNLIETIHKNKPFLVAATKALGTFNPKIMTFDLAGKMGRVPYHPAAIRYLKEIGQWPPVK